jgi:RND family efflux transporter MFP subunit
MSFAQHRIERERRMILIDLVDLLYLAVGPPFRFDRRIKFALEAARVQALAPRTFNMKMRVRPNPAGALAPSLCALLIISGCRAHSSDAEIPAAPAVAVAAVQRGGISQLLSVAGQFQPYQVVDVHAKVSGYVQRINVDIGDRVRAGQTLAVLEVPELNAQYRASQSEELRSQDQITQAQHEVAQAKSLHSSLQANYDRLQQAAKEQPGLIAQQELDDAGAQADASQARIDAAQASLSASREQADTAKADKERVGALQSYTTVTAPLNGVVTWRYADTGALIQAGTSSDVQSLPLVKLSQSDLLRLRFPVPEDAVNYVHVGDAVQIRVDALHRSITGKIVRFTRDVSLDTRTMQTEVDVPNADLSITPGMYANAYLQLAHKEGILTIPLSAIHGDGRDATVLVLDANNRIQSRDVQVGLRGSQLAEVSSGLNEGDRVVLDDGGNYKTGEVVAPRLRQEPASDVMHEEGGMTDPLSEQTDASQGAKGGDN